MRHFPMNIRVLPRVLAAALLLPTCVAPAYAGFAGDAAALMTYGKAGNVVSSFAHATLPYMPYGLLALTVLTLGCSTLVRLGASRHAPRANQTIYASPVAFIAMWPMSPGQSELDRARR